MWKLIMGFACLSLLLTACGDESDDSEAAESKSKVSKMTDLLAYKKRKLAGAELFGLYCVACHGEDGRGGGQYPSLKGSEIIQGDARRLVLLIHKGARGPKIIDGVDYGLDEMPAWEASLDAAQTVNLLSYVRSAWGNRPEQGGSRDLIEVEQVQEWLDRLREIEGPLPFECLSDGTWERFYEGNP